MKPVNPILELNEMFPDANRRTKKSIRWFEDNIEKLYKPGAKPTLGDVYLSNRANRQGVGERRFIGRMYLFQYVPKHKQTLPYYDSYPLVVPLSFDSSNNSMLGMNLHYLPPRLRGVLFYNMLKHTTNKKFDEFTRFSISYEDILDYATLKGGQVCIKRYLNTHIRSNVLNIPADHWHPAVFLPFQRFRKKDEGTVWAESRRKYNKL